MDVFMLVILRYLNETFGGANTELLKYLSFT
jgi:hypothetical protein